MSTATATATPTAAAKAATADKVNLTNNPVARAAVEALRHARAEKKRLDKVEKESIAAIRDALGSAHQGVILGNVVVKITDPITHRTFHADTLLAAYPEAYAAALRESEYTKVVTI